MSTPTGSERRRFARSPLRLEADLLLPDGAMVECVVLDFCLTGLFIAIDDMPLEPIPIGADVVLDCVLPAEIDTRSFSLPLVVRRRTDAGVGVSFKEPDPEVVERLSRLSAAAEVRAQHEGAAPVLTAEQHAALEDLVKLAEKAFPTFAARFLSAADTALFLAARDAGNNIRERQFLDAQVELRGRTEGVRKTALALWLAGIRNLENPVGEGGDLGDTTIRGDGKVADTTSSRRKFTLIDKEDFEEFLLVSEATAILEQRFRDTLNDLNDRLGQLAGREVGFPDNPLGPAALCQCITANLKEISAERAPAEVVFRSLVDTLKGLLGPFYDEINGQLIARGVLPVIRREARVRETRAPKRPPAEREAARVAEAVMPGLMTVLGGDGNDEHRAGYGGRGGIGGGGGGGAGGSGHGSGPSDGAIVRGAGGGLPRAYATAARMLDLRRQVIPARRAEASSGADPLASDEVLDELVALQGTLAREASPTILSASELRDRVGQRASARSQRPRRLDDEQDNAFEVVSGLLLSLIDDVLVSRSAKDLLGRIQLPLHRLALIDQTFFSRADHPARQVVDRVAQISDHFAERPDTRAVMEQLVEDANEVFTDDPVVFDLFIQQLGRLLEKQRGEYAQQVTGVIEDCDRQQILLAERRGEQRQKPASEADLPAEWHRWLKRGRSLAIGQRFVNEAGTPREAAVTLAWVGTEGEPFVFVDEAGEKAATYTLQQVAMFLRRGLLRPVPQSKVGPVDRALQGVVGTMHIELDADVVEDPGTGFMAISPFLEAVNHRLDNPESGKNTLFVLLDARAVRRAREAHGEEAADALMGWLAAQVKAAVPGPRSLFGRLAEDKLAVLAEGLPLATVEQKFGRMLETLHREGVPHGGNRLALRALAGVVNIDDRVEAADGLIETARAALAQHEGEGYVMVAGRPLESEKRDRMQQLVTYLDRAWERERLVLAAREAASLDPQLPGFRELLVAANDRGGKLVPPELVMRALPRCARAAEIDRWLVTAALRWAATQSADDERFIVIPMTSASLAQEELAQDIMALLMEHPIPPGKLCFLLDNEAVVAHLEAAQDLTRSLREFGCRFALDQFGSGQKSYGYLRELDLDFVMVQGGFFERMERSEEARAMVQSIRELANFSGLKTCARGGAGEAARNRARSANLDYFCAREPCAALGVPDA